MSGAAEADVAFIVGDSLGKLLKWLRIFGFSAVPERQIAKGGSPASPERADPVVLTRSRSKLQRTRGTVVYIESDLVFQQLQEVVRACGIAPGQLKLFSRCLHCNTSVEPIDKTHIRGRIPDYVWESHENFSFCPVCDRIFWQGTHAATVQETVERIFETAFSGGRDVFLKDTCRCKR